MKNFHFCEFESSENLSGSFELRRKNYLEHVQMKINSSILKISSSSNSSSLPRIIASSSAQLRLFSSSSSAKRSSSFEFAALLRTLLVKSISEWGSKKKKVSEMKEFSSNYAKRSFTPVWNN